MCALSVQEHTERNQFYELKCSKSEKKEELEIHKIWINWIHNFFSRKKTTNTPRKGNIQKKKNILRTCFFVF